MNLKKKILFYSLFMLFLMQTSQGQQQYSWKYFDTVVFQRYSVGRSERDSIFAIEIKKEAVTSDNVITVAYPISISSNGYVNCQKFYYSGVLSGSYVFSSDEFWLDQINIDSYDIETFKKTTPGTKEWADAAIALCYEGLDPLIKRISKQITIYVPIADPKFTTNSLNYHGAFFQINSVAKKPIISFDLMAPNVIH
jgi:hypothetical protein